MSPARLASGVLVSALLRRVDQAGGTAMLLARGDATAGGVLVACLERGRLDALLELGSDGDGRAVWRQVAAGAGQGEESLDAYVRRRRDRDPDLWALELDVPDSQRFAAEMIAAS